MKDPGILTSNVTSNDKRTIGRLSMKFFLNGETLYKRNHDLVLLRCVDENEAKIIMKEVHDGICGTHANDHMMAKQILRTGYYWIKYIIEKNEMKTEEEKKIN